MNQPKNIINDFIDTELKNQYMLNDLLTISKMPNIVQCEYECNQYNVIFLKSECRVIILDNISEKHGVLQDNTRISISQSEFINILTSIIDSI